MNASDLYRSLFRIAVGLYWLYFASQKWLGVGWMKPLIQGAYRVNPIPGLHELLAVVVAPNWFLFAVAQAAGETVVATLLILGIATRKAAIGGFLLALGLALVVGFEAPDLGFRWLYYLAVLVNAELIVVEPGSIALERLKAMPAWLRS